MSRRTALIVLGLTACSPDAPPPGEPANAIEAAVKPVPTSAPDPAIARPEVILEGNGLRVQARGRTVRLVLEESPQAEVEAALAPLGTPERNEGPADCPAGPLSFLNYPNGFQVSIQEGKFAGYWATARTSGVQTSGGIRPGSPRSALGKATIEEASFGKLAILDGVVALLNEDGTAVGELYAGLACIYD